MEFKTECGFALVILLLAKYASSSGEVDVKVQHTNHSKGRSLYPYPQIGFLDHDIPQQGSPPHHPVHSYPQLVLQPRPLWPLMYQNPFHPDIAHPPPQITAPVSTSDNSSAPPQLAPTQLIDPQKESTSKQQLPNEDENSVIHQPQRGIQDVPTGVSPTSGSNILSTTMNSGLKNNTIRVFVEESQQQDSVSTEAEGDFAIPESEIGFKFPVKTSSITAVVKQDHIGLKPSPPAPLRDLSPSEWLEQYKKCRPKPPGSRPPNRPPGRPPKPPARPPPRPPSRPPRPPIRPPRPPLRPPRPPLRPPKPPARPPPRPPIRPPRPPLRPPRPPLRPPRPPVRPTRPPPPPEDYDEVIEDDPPAPEPPHDYEEGPPVFVPPGDYEYDTPEEYDDYGDDYDQVPPWWQGIGGEIGEYGLIGPKPLPPNAAYWLKHNVTVKPVYWTDLLAPSSSAANIPLQNMASLLNSLRSRGVKKKSKTRRR